MKNPVRLKIRHTAPFLTLALSHLVVGQITNTYEWIYQPAVPPVAGAGEWNIGANWALNAPDGVTGVVPSSLADAARITNGGTAVIQENSNVEVGLIFVGSAGGSFLTNNADVSVTARQFRIGSGQAGTLTLNLGELRLVSREDPADYNPAIINPELVVGIEGGGLGTLTQTGGVLNTEATALNAPPDGSPVGTLPTKFQPDTRIGAFGANGIYNLSGGSAELYNLRVGFASSASTGTINHSGGTLNHNGELALGWADATGIYNLSGTGSLTTNNRIRVGATGGTHGFFNQSGGTAVISGGRLELGTEDGAVGTYNMSGGVMTVNDDILLGCFVDNKGTQGIYNQTGGAVKCGSVRICFAIGSKGEVNLKGGTLTANSIFQENPNATGSLTIDGGTIVATGGGDFVRGLPLVTVNAGGATFNSNGQGSNIVPPVKGAGGLTKTGGGFISLTALSDYSGDTIIREGGLFLNVAGGLDPASDVIIGSVPPVEGREFPRLELKYTGMDTVSQLIIDGVSLPPGIYGSAEAPGDHLLNDHILGTGLLKVEPAAVVPGYDGWASDPANGLAAGERAPGFDADHDGFDNLLEYFLGGNPKVSSTAIAPVLGLASSDVKVTFNRSVDSGGDTTAVVQWTTDLQNWLPANQIVVTGTGAITTTIPGSNAANGRIFTRLKVTKP